ncbi:winged helix-turn-helix transcriptional regulator [Fodinicola feengrottensis]|uniref:winged helix-turn-helix transcriptional regulator n=1 Tax=Fodinicola feengrottensis TaxID=435914 RepID=UPI0036F1EF1D
MATLSDKWVTLVLSALADGPLRYSGISRIVAGASQKMLTQTLRKLERDGLVARSVTPSVPVRVDYELTRWASRFCPYNVPLRRGPRRISRTWRRPAKRTTSADRTCVRTLLGHAYATQCSFVVSSTVSAGRIT